MPLSRGPLRRALQAGVAALVLAGAVSAGVAAAANAPAPPLAPGTARLVPGDAEVTVHRATPVARADALLRAGDSLTVTRGIATLRTDSGAMHARGGSAIAITDGAPRITRGDVLVQGQAFDVAMRSATVAINGVARVRQGLSLEVGLYRGGAVVRTVTETFGLPRLRRAIVAGVGGPASVTTAPLVINATDTWDRKFLGDAIELDAALSARSRGITMQLAGRGKELIGQVAATAGWSDLTVLASQPIGEFVVAAELARAAKLGDDAVPAALRLRADGASWGLIALEQGVRVLPARFAGLDAIVVPVVANVIATNSPAVETRNTGSAPTTETPTPKIKLPAPTTASQPPVTVTPAPAPAPEPSNPVDGLVEDVDNLLGGLL
ncbi:MAG TPA: hypothetical protein VMZ22_12050 [Acidimicrobiales bacterium]|nr:hypothetical protein [Acidimicrobiales bacterium]